MSLKIISSGPLRLNCWGPSQAFHPTAAWMPALPFRGLQFNLMIQALDGSHFRARPGYQLAEVRPDVSAPPTTAFGWAASAGWHRFTTTPPDVSKQFFWRPGILYSLSDGAFGSADVALETQFFTSSEYLPRRTMEVQPYNDANNTVAVTPVTDWVPSVHLKHVKAAVVVANNSVNTMQNQLFVRWADDVNAPGSTWAGLELGWNTPLIGNTERNTGVLGPVTIGGANAQFGIGVRKTSGAPNRATIHVATILERE